VPSLAHQVDAAVDMFRGVEDGVVTLTVVAWQSTQPKLVPSSPLFRAWRA
jgi:hypothetical protein